MKTLQNSLQLACLNTPLQRFAQFEQPNRPNIWLKRDDLTGFVLSGNKVRKLNYILASAIAAGADTILTTGGIQSNHCRATAAAASQCGLKTILILRDDTPDQPNTVEANYWLDHVYGADIRVVPCTQWHELDRVVQSVMAEYEALGNHVFYTPTGGSDAIGLLGYRDVAYELTQQSAAQGLRLQHVVSATGSGGTQAGLTQGFYELANLVKVEGIAVSDDAAYFHSKVLQDIVAFGAKFDVSNLAGAKQIRVADGYVGAGYGLADDSLLLKIRQWARDSGLLFDPVYTGKAFDGFLTRYEAGFYGESGDIVFVHTGGGFGIFPFANRMLSLPN